MALQIIFIDDILFSRRVCIEYEMGRAKNLFWQHFGVKFSQTSPVGLSLAG